MTKETQNPEEIGESGFSLKTVSVAVFLTLFLLASSSYITLKIGALPWPIIFSVVVSGVLLNFLKIFGKKTNIHEINVAQSGGTIGALMAAGITFTIPGILYLKQQGVDIFLPDSISLLLVCLAAGILGILLSLPMRRILIDEENLPYPSGKAGAEIIKAGASGGRNAFLVVISGLFIGLFVLLRESYFPVGFVLFSALSIHLFFYPMPLAIGVGYILGKRTSFNWFLGALIGWVIIIPFLVGVLGFEEKNASSLVQNLGMGMVLGTGIGFFLTTLAPKTKKIFLPFFNLQGPWYTKLILPMSLISIFILHFVGVPFLASILAVIGAGVMSMVAARTTGETDIDPLEQFGIIVGLITIFFYAFLNLNLGYLPAFIIICFVSIVCALAGDIGHDYKGAKIIGTKPIDIFKCDLVCALFAALFAPFVLNLILKNYKNLIFTEMMPAPQSQLVAGSISGFSYPGAFYFGFLLALFFVVFQRLKKKEMPFLPMVFGIGLFLGLTLGLLLFIGGLIGYLIERKFSNLSYPGILVAAGIMGGEGIIGFSLAAFRVLGLDYMLTIKYLIFSLLVLIPITIYFGKKKTNLLCQS